LIPLWKTLNMFHQYCLFHHILEFDSLMQRVGNHVIFFLDSCITTMYFRGWPRKKIYSSFFNLYYHLSNVYLELFIFLSGLKMFHIESSLLFIIKMIIYLYATIKNRVWDFTLVIWGVPERKLRLTTHCCVIPCNFEPRR
jgi:hypothetical protein